MDNGEGSSRSVEAPGGPEGAQNTGLTVHQALPTDLRSLLATNAFGTSPLPIPTVETDTETETETASFSEYVGSGGNSPTSEHLAMEVRPAYLGVPSHARRNASEMHLRAVFNAHRSRSGQDGDLPSELTSGRASPTAGTSSVPPSLRLPPIHQAMTMLAANDSRVLPPIWGAPPAGSARRSFSLPPPSRRQEQGEGSQDPRAPSLMMLATAALQLAPARERVATPPAGVIDDNMTDIVDDNMTDVMVDDPAEAMNNSMANDVASVEEEVLPPALPEAPIVHNRWLAVFVRNCVCDVCDTSGHPVIQRCTERICGWQVCRACVQAGRLDVRHVLDEESVTWIDPRPGSRRARARRNAQQ